MKAQVDRARWTECENEYDLNIAENITCLSVLHFFSKRYFQDTQFKGKHNVKKIIM